MLIMAGGAIFQPVVGMLLDLHTTSPVGENGLPVYGSSDYTFALSVVPIGVALGIFLTLFLKETHCESQDERMFAPQPLLSAVRLHKEPELATENET